MKLYSWNPQTATLIKLKLVQWLNPRNNLNKEDMELQTRISIKELAPTSTPPPTSEAIITQTWNQSNRMRQWLNLKKRRSKKENKLCLILKRSLIKDSKRRRRLWKTCSSIQPRSRKPWGMRKTRTLKNTRNWSSSRTSAINYTLTSKNWRIKCNSWRRTNKN